MKSANSQNYHTGAYVKEQARNLTIISVRITVVEVLTEDQLRVNSFDRQGGREDTGAETKPSTTWGRSSEGFLLLGPGASC